MKNDLSPFEKNLLHNINLENNTNFNYKNLMEWSSSEEAIKNNLQHGEKIYTALGVFVAIKEL